MSSSGTRSPRSRIGWTCAPELGSVGDRRAQDVPRRDVRGVVAAAAIRFACVPLPDPCGPRIRILMRRDGSRPT